jgi:heptosyltransferase-3
MLELRQINMQKGINSGAKRILIVRTDRVGDVVMTTPLIRELRRTFPDSYIAALTNPNSADVLLNNPHLDKIITDDLKKKSFREIVKQLRIEKFTHGLLVIPTERAAYQMFLAGVKNRIGVGRKLYEVITMMKSVSRNKYIPLRHEADYCMDLARKIGVISGNLQPEIFLTKDEKASAGKLLKDAGVDMNLKKIIIHTGSGRSSSNWSEEKYLILAEEVLNSVQSVQLLFTAREMSKSFKERLEKLSQKVFIIDEKFKRLRELIGVISQVDILIAPSTGPLHIASALGIKTIGLFCHRPMNCVKHWGALGDKAVNLEVSSEYCDRFCSPDKEVCNFEEGINIEEVIDNLQLIIGN